jgi:hypothetical protein
VPLSTSPYLDGIRREFKLSSNGAKNWEYNPEEHVENQEDISTTLMISQINTDWDTVKLNLSRT